MARSLTDGSAFPPTVTDHRTHDDGATLITIDSSEDSNIQVYDDDRTAHRVDETPEWAE